ncbi:unnamed protein product, partial [Ranitomeya imitator]
PFLLCFSFSSTFFSCYHFLSLLLRPSLFPSFLILLRFSFCLSPPSKPACLSFFLIEHSYNIYLFHVVSDFEASRYFYFHFQHINKRVTCDDHIEFWAQTEADLWKTFQYESSKNHEDGTIQVNQDALQTLSGITQKVVVVAIVGKYRTGKSYLMNRLAGRKNGFSLGSTVQSMTKGIWMWCVPHPFNKEQTLVLIDTEGLGDVEKGNSQNDSWIFALAVLLSSSLVFNSVGTIDQQAMDQLHYVTELTEKIKIKSSELEADLEDDSSEFKRTFPSFVWCVRDFSLELKIDGKDITEDEYLKNALRLKKGLSPAVQNYNLPRECLLHYFHSHKCFVFDRPAPKTVLQNLDNIEETQLDASFVEQTKKFCDYIYRNSQVKSLSGGYKITGRGLGDLAVSYVEAIRSGSIPSLENAVLALTKLENSRAIVEASSKYDEMMSQNTSKFPTETCDEFLNLHKACQSEALNVFMNLSFKDENQEYQGKLAEELERKKAAYISQNEEASVRKCKALLEELSAGMKKAINDGKFSVAGGYKLFTEEKENIGG